MSGIKVDPRVKRLAAIAAGKGCAHLTRHELLREIDALADAISEELVGVAN